MLVEALSAQLSLLLLLAAIACERWLPLSPWYHPFTLARLGFNNLVKRTFNPQDSVGYHLLIAILSLALCVLLPLTLIALFSHLVYYPEALSALLLYLSLDSHTIRSKSTRIALALKQQRKSLARALLATIVVRDCERLNSQGVAKACIESVVLRMLHTYFAPLLLYCLFGGIAALAYSLTWTLHTAMRKHALPSSPYLYASKWLLTLCCVAALVMYLLPLAMMTQQRKLWRYLRIYGRHFYHRVSGFTLSVFSTLLQVQLGGPAFYQGHRFERMRIGVDHLPDDKTIKATLKYIDGVNMLWLAVIALSHIAWA
ncbi:cobalamin biosynthesis protein [Pseudoalteromonas sp. CNC9-20]|uniref:cobalamin biosynthesis protein n=1 Tax=Pseudoalteromonas sp. CNC9-20 TaxID=2917750 RepID=UPI001EF71A8B|nr:cobalamin biosynthesis protein [Pseudoalteromonas sp. CNC9-20]MCG7570872.1 cobalamin biosynthesis protein [Pseudoalteromonas sp. CNC9-20]